MTGRLFLHRFPYKFPWLPAHRGCKTEGRRVVLSSMKHQPDFFWYANVGQMDHKCLEAFAKRRLPQLQRNDYYLNVHYHMKPTAIHINRQLVPVPAGKYYIVNPTDVSYPDTKKGVAVLRCGFSQPFLRECRESVGIPKSAGAFDFDTSPRTPTPALRAAFGQISSLLRQPSQPDRDPWLPQQLFGWGREVIRELWFSHPNRLRERLLTLEFPAAVDPRLQQALDYLQTHLVEPIALTAVGRAAGLSSRNLFRLFQQQLGNTPHDYLRRRRVEEAARLLKRTSPQTVQVVAERVGFKTAWGLRRAWKFVRGDSPTSRA